MLDEGVRPKDMYLELYECGALPHVGGRYYSQNTVLSYLSDIIKDRADTRGMLKRSIIEAAKAGKSRDEIAIELKASRAYVRSVLMHAKLVSRERPVYKKHFFTDEEVIEIRQLNLQGYKTAVIAERFNARADNIRRIVRRETYTYL